MGRGGFGKSAVTVTAAAAVVVALLALATPAAQEPRPFRATIDFVSTDVIVRKDDAFVPGLRAGDFRVYEDDVLQTITMFEAWIGGRSTGNLVSTGGRAAAGRRRGLRRRVATASTQTRTELSHEHTNPFRQSEA